METARIKQPVLLPEHELQLRLQRLQAQIQKAAIDGAIINDIANIYYLTGRVYSGMAYIPATGEPLWLVKRPVGLEGAQVAYIRKPEDMPQLFAQRGIPTPTSLGLEMGTTPYTTIERYKKTFATASCSDITPMMRRLRATKTPYEIEKIKMSGAHHERVYRRVPRLFKPGMTDIELQVEIERLSRIEGCLGQFRISGDSMELFMGNIIAGDNADAPSPYDFAMGGAGIDPSIPVGADGTVLCHGMSVMVDVNGNYTGYMTDMTRVFAVGEINDLAMRAHQLSIDIHSALTAMGTPGTEAKTLYDRAMQIVEEANLTRYFMGHRQHAGFIGHGVGIEVNELPVIAPRSRDIIEVGNVIALEPKFVIPRVGAVGIENTYVVTDDGWKCLTNAPQEIISFIE